MELRRGANGRNPIIPGRLRILIRLPALIILVLVLLTSRSVALAGNLDKVALFDIKAQTLEEALVQFGVQAHVQIVFASKSSMGRTRTVALKGKYTARQALANLLRGSRWEFVENGNTAEIVPNARTSSESGSYGQRVDPNQGKGESAQGTGDSTIAPDPPEKRSEAKPKVLPLQEVVVTGTHIHGAPVSSPLITMTRQDIEQSGYTTVGDFIRSMPDNFGSAGPQTIIGAAPNTNGSPSGASSPDLHGLGAGSTLTLVDGQRLAVDSVTGSVDISLIPTAVINRIEVLTGGASAIYGSDAVSGVVNIILRKSFNGAKATVLSGGTTDGGGTERGFNQMLGKTWTTGGAIFDYEFDKQDPILASQRTYTESAGSVTTTLPGMSRSSLYMGANQDFGPASAFVEGLYTYRIVRDGFSNGSLYPSENENVNVHQFSASSGLNAPLPLDWSVSLVGDLSEQRTLVETGLMPAAPTPIAPLLYEGQTRSVETTASGPIFTGPSGTVRGAVGGGYRVETYSDDQGSTSEVPGARRTVGYGYGELEIPLIASALRQALTLDLSGRSEHYSDFGAESVPKVGLTYMPSDEVKFRTTWGKAFRAPPLFEEYVSTGLLYSPLPDPLSPSGVSNVLQTVGGNRLLKPETAKTWTVGMDYVSKAIEGFRGSITYFDVAYRNRIGQIADPFTALTDPLNAPFVMRTPSEAYVQGLLNSAAFVANLVGTPINPADVPAVVNDGYVNVAAEDVFGLDLDLKYLKVFPLGKLEPFIDNAFLDLRQKLVPGGAEVQISGMVFEPPKFRSRGGVSWITHRWTITGIINYVGSEINTYQTGLPHIASWTTVDFNLAWRPRDAGVLSGLGLSMSMQNAFNRQPPFVEFDQYVPGIHYDSLNANDFGRVMRVSVSWAFR